MPKQSARLRPLPAQSLPAQSREVTAGGLYMAHSDYAATFAAGTADSVTIVVDWRDGLCEVVSALPD